MAINLDELNTNVLRVIQNSDEGGRFLQDFLGGEVGDVTYTVVDSSGATIVRTVPNIAKYTQSVNDALNDSNRVTYFVSQLSGDDTNDGLTSATALKSIKKAVELAAYKNELRINFISGETYVLDERIVLSGGRLVLISTDLNNPSTIRSILKPTPDVSGGGTETRSNGRFATSGAHTHIDVRNVILETAPFTDVSPLAYSHAGSGLFTSVFGQLMVTVENHGLVSVHGTALKNVLLNYHPLIQDYPGIGRTALIFRSLVCEVPLNSPGTLYEANVGEVIFTNIIFDDANGAKPLKERIVGRKFNTSDLQPYNIVSNLDLRL